MTMQETLSRYLTEREVDHIEFMQAEMQLKALGGKGIVDLVAMGFAPDRALEVAANFFTSIGKEGSNEKVLDHYSVGELRARFNAIVDEARR
ncbi:hypothetical protein HU230_0036815 [Bradyrhizobium quebecense]|uniref:Uncharacterized protein n=1 Tax=Bradyrhizobium quebecense TaxID=2748629 RepID=A0A974AHR2_9BRAD|nr:hypothetical protein [Bradyrhizobium quebecense]UGA43752.1 hypothetical protein HU230_0036815 [Bradyrhizobium quebecense]